MNKINQLKTVLVELNKSVKKLNQLYPREDGKDRFPLDGRLVGDIGEVIASEVYGIKLFSKQKSHHDGCKDDLLIQIKATLKDRIRIRFKPEYLICIKLFKDGSFQEIYNGPSSYLHSHWPNWEYENYKYRSISIKRLASISKKNP